MFSVIRTRAATGSYMTKYEGALLNAKCVSVTTQAYLPRICAKTSMHCCMEMTV